jgi:ribosomal protein L37E
VIAAADLSQNVAQGLPTLGKRNNTNPMRCGSQRFNKSMQNLVLKSYKRMQEK